jgi:SpoVK/Ycf46/Vps4 family AAA+-type ATPase
VGETEGNLTKLFKAAETNGIFLVIDECDSLLIKRTPGSSDYSNRVTTHFLNLLENYGGNLICTTNLSHALDPAFERRFDKHVCFDLPSSSEVKSILKALLEPDAPLSSDFNYDQAVGEVILTGGYIRNAVEAVEYRRIKNNERFITSQMMQDELKTFSMIADKVRLRLVNGMIKSDRELDKINELLRVRKVGF